MSDSEHSSRDQLNLTGMYRRWVESADEVRNRPTWAGITRQTSQVVTKVPESEHSSRDQSNVTGMYRQWVESTDEVRNRQTWAGITRQTSQVVIKVSESEHSSRDQSNLTVKWQSTWIYLDLYWKSYLAPWSIKLDWNALTVSGICRRGPESTYLTWNHAISHPAS
jgi:hypothetical protein